jgi:hypothetical protein
MVGCFADNNQCRGIAIGGIIKMHKAAEIADGLFVSTGEKKGG